MILVLVGTIDVTVLNSAGWRRPSGQPVPSPPHGFSSQQPWNDGVCIAHVHHFPTEHFTLGQYEASLLVRPGSGPGPVPMPAARRSLAGHVLLFPWQGLLVQHPRNVGFCAVQVYLDSTMSIRQACGMISCIPEPSKRASAHSVAGHAGPEIGKNL